MLFFQRIKPTILTLYFLLIGTGFGAVIVSGAFVAPSIFGAAAIVSDLEITLLQSGILMTSIFVKVNFLLNILAFCIIFFEILNFRINSAKIAPIFGLLSVILIFLFTLYYTPIILKAQSIGEKGIQTVLFHMAHKYSVIVFKVLIFTLLGLFIARIYPLFKR